MPTGWTRGTLALALSPLGLVLIASTRLLIISDYNSTTAIAVASAGGYVNTLLGTVIPLVPILLPYLALVLLFFRKLILSLLTFFATALVSPTKLAPIVSLSNFRNDWRGFVVSTKSHALFIGAFILILFIVAVLAMKEYDDDFKREAVGIVRRSDKSITQIAADLGINAKLLRSWVNGQPSFRGFRLGAAVTATALLIPYIYYLYPIPRAIMYYKTLMSEPWIASERITVQSGGSVVGYPLSIAGGWMAVLTADTREIQYIPAADVKQRIVCQIGSESRIISLSSPLVPLFNAKGPSLPSCQGSSSSAIFGSPLDLQMSRWTTTKVATSSGAFRPVASMSDISICASNYVTATLSVELNAAPAGFRIRVDSDANMNPGAVRFVPAGLHDSFSFTFTEDMRVLKDVGLHTFNVEWRSPTGSIVTLERGTLVLHYQDAGASCPGM
jgi:hypothetical protein